MEKLDGDRLAVFNVPMIRSKLSITGGGGSIVFNAGTTSGNLSAISFADSNGISFGLNAGTMTASVAPGAGAGTGFTSTSTAGSNVAGTLGAGGLSMGIPAYLTTAMASNAGSNFVAATAGFFGTNATGTIASNGISVSVAPPTGGGAGTGFTTTTTAGTNIVGTLDTNGLSMGVPAYLTAATAGGAGTGFSTSSTAGSDIVGTLNSNGLAMGVPAYLTTAALSQDSSKYAGTNGAITGGSITVNTSGVSVALPAYLTTAGLSGDTSKYAGIGESTSTVAGTALGLTVDTAGVQIAYPNWLTTAALSQDSSKYAGTGTSATNASITLDTNGLAISVAPPTAAAIKFSAGTLSSNRSDITFGDSNGVSFGLETNGVITATVKTDYLTTAALSGDTSKYAGVGETTATVAGTALGLTVDTAGVNIAYPNWLTTAALSQDSSKYAGTGFTTATTAGTNLVGTLATNGLSMGVPAWLTAASAGGAGTGFTSASTAGSDIVATLDSNGLSMGVPAYLTTATAAANVNISAGTTSTNASAFTFQDSNGVSFGLGTGASAGIITATVATNYITLSHATLSYWQNVPLLTNTSQTLCQSNSFWVAPLTVQNYVSASYLRMFGSISFTSTTIATSAVNNVTGASTTFNETQAWNVNLYTVGTGTASRILQHFFSTSAGLTWQVTVSQASTSNASRQSFSQAITFPNEGFTTDVITTQYSVTATNGPISTTQWSNLSALRFLDIPFATIMTPGNYWVALNRISGTQGGKNMDMRASSFGFNEVFNSWKNINSTAFTTGDMYLYGCGVFTTNVAQTTSSIGFTAITGDGNTQWYPYIQLIRQA